MFRLLGTGGRRLCRASLTEGSNLFGASAPLLRCQTHTLAEVGAAAAKLFGNGSVALCSVAGCSPNGLLAAESVLRRPRIGGSHVGQRAEPAEPRILTSTTSSRAFLRLAPKPQHHYSIGNTPNIRWA